ncbi:hypothetical protein V2P20_07390 [Methylobacter sp. Wu1]|uniref:tetratricopeptide repeat protein n=1 Tax=Methylobacter sp. Wu1 TaxID=3119359 RepID=UPI002F94920F
MPAFLLKVFFLIAALGLEMTSIGMMIMSDRLPESDLLIMLLLHLSACIVIAIALPTLLRFFHPASRLITVLFFFMIAFYMPALGMLGLVLSLVPGLHFSKATAQELPLRFSGVREFSDAPASHGLHSKNMTASLEGLLRSQNPCKRLSAVYATLKLEDKDAIPLLKMALRDPVDDIRLLAYALIDRKEQRISERIERARQSLENNKTRNVRHLYKSIVKDYWELAHLGLVEGETLVYVLNKAREYLESGLQHYPRDRGLHLQYAKLLLRLGEHQLAYDEFKAAEALGVERKRLLLYYAEIDFLRRRYGEVKRHMRAVDWVTARPQIQAAMCFWQGKRELHG